VFYSKLLYLPFSICNLIWIPENTCSTHSIEYTYEVIQNNNAVAEQGTLI
jgi:hypothetical protein